MAAAKPAWRAAFDSVDQRISPVAEKAVRTDAFADLVGGVAKVQREALKVTERSLRRMWHRWNLPAATDVKRLSVQVVSLERQVRELTAALEAQQSALRPATPRPAASTRTSRTARPRTTPIEVNGHALSN